jgi:hypothetical protein
MPRRARPDGFVMDPGHGGSARLASLQATLATPGEMADRAAERAGARDLDRAVEQMPGLTRLARDRERAMPRDTTAPVPDPRMERILPESGTVRRPLSSRQRKPRSVAKRAWQDSLPGTGYDALSSLVTDAGYRSRLNDALTGAAGDAQQLEDGDRVLVQRIDRAIQSYESRSNRGHVIYVNMRLPRELTGMDPVGAARSYLPDGTIVELDRFTGGAHCMHEIEVDGGDRVPVLEIQTRRGAYLGRSDSLDDTTHVLPRGLRLRKVGEHMARYERRDGSLGRRPVIQFRDVSDD